MAKTIARCELCKKTFKLGTMGCGALDSHMKSEKHQPYLKIQKTNMAIDPFTAAKRFPNMPALTVSATPSGLTDATSSRPTPVTAVTTAFSAFCMAEVLWVLNTVSHHNSYNSNLNINSVFAEMFPDSELAKTFTCGKDKTAYFVRFGLAPYIKTELISKVNEDAFVIMFDESMNRSTKNKQLDLHVRHWMTDETGTHVQSRFFGSQFLGHSRADDLLEHFKVNYAEGGFFMHLCIPFYIILVSMLLWSYLVIVIIMYISVKICVFCLSLCFHLWCISWLK